MNPPSVVTALRRPTLRHLYNFVQQVQRAALPASSPLLTLPPTSPPPASSPTPSLHRLLTSSSSFLSSYLPPRLYAIHHTHHYHSYSLPLTSLPSFAALSALYHRLSLREEWVDVGGGGDETEDGIERFGAWSMRCMEDMEAAVRTLTHELRDVMAVALRGKDDNDEAGRAKLQNEVNTLLDVTHSILIEMRLHLSHYQYAHSLYTQTPPEGHRSRLPTRSTLWPPCHTRTHRRHGTWHVCREVRRCATRGSDGRWRLGGSGWYWRRRGGGGSGGTHSFRVDGVAEE